VGKVLGSRIEGDYGFVQYETKRKAQVAAVILNASTFKSNQLTVRSTNLDWIEKLYQNSENAGFQLKEEEGSGPSGSTSLARAELRRPDQMQKLLKRLADNRLLTASQYEEVIEYLEAENKELWKPKSPETEWKTDPMENKTNGNLLFPTFGDAMRDECLMNLLYDQGVQETLKCLYNSGVKDITEFN